MRLLMIAAAATLLLPAATPAKACGTAVPSAKATSADYSAAKHKKRAKKAAIMKQEKVEYMRAAPMK
jgi:hypothetical protein